jgi:CO/xanthine dehydrogenase FAD-binding subunit
MSDKSTVHTPRTVEEACKILAKRPDGLRVIAGGTDLMVLMNARMLDAGGFLDIWRVDEMRGIIDEGPGLRIGALTTYTQLIRSPLVQQHVPSLVAASRTIGAIQIQNRGTLGGNIVNASPAGDSLPVLAAFDAEIEIGSIRGTRRVGFNQFYTGYRRTVLESDELVLAVRIPKLESGERDFFYKVGTRRAQAISKVVMAARVRSVEGRIESLQIGVGSVAPTVIRARNTESLLAGSTMNPNAIEQARHLIAQEVKPITDLRSTERYRRVVTANLLGRLLRQLSQTNSRQT